MSNKLGDRLVNVTDAIIAVETEKSYGIVLEAAVKKAVNPDSMTTVKELREFIDIYVIWIPKSIMKDIKTKEANIFTHLKVKYPSKFNPDMIPYKTSISFQIPLWIAAERKIPYEGSDAQVEQDNNNDKW